MRILTITAQKPNSTGSGFYLTELVKEFAALGHNQAVISGIYREDRPEFPEGVKSYPVYFKTQELPFAICGMSDEMPYESTVYGQMTEEMTAQFRAAFRRVIRQAAEEFRPELVVCHHLYLVTALAREELAGIPVCGFCHNTDLRQMKKIPLEREFIRSRIGKLDRIFALHQEQKQEIFKIYPVQEEQITVAGTGYNQAVFFPEEALAEVPAAADTLPSDTAPTDTAPVGQAPAPTQEADGYPERQTAGKPPLRLVYAGKIAEKKGVACLIRSLEYLERRPEEVTLSLAGGAGNQEEYERIRALAEKSRYPVRFLGKLPQPELAGAYRESNLFVLPSFSEGLPLTIIEAMACGCRVIVSDLPGIRPWVSENVERARISYVTPPEMRNADEPVEGSLEPFEKRLAEAIEEAAGRLESDENAPAPDLGRISWERICRLVCAEA